MIHYLVLTPRDPLIARDGRPFGIGQGYRMRSLDWPYPSVLAGALRTLLGKLCGGEFTQEMVEPLKRVESSGPLPLVAETLYFPAAKDSVLCEAASDNQTMNGRKVMPLRPLRLGTGTKNCDLPDGLTPVVVTEDAKPARAPEFWSAAKMYSWLMDAEGREAEPPPEKPNEGIDYLFGPEKDERTHVRVNRETGAAEESMIFMTVGLDCSSKYSVDGITLSARVEAEDKFAEALNGLDMLHPMGGERRLVHWRAKRAVDPWELPNLVRSAASKNLERLRLVLATPALFKEGWKPEWLDNKLEGCPPNVDIKLRLVSACVDRWKPLSGWSLEVGRVGPKEVRRLVPAGSVYFFEVVTGDPQALIDKLWLRSVSDDEQDRRDGFGLALWGIWDYAN
jgi:CRISPR-associated protein Cmr3